MSRPMTESVIALRPALRLAASSRASEPRLPPAGFPFKDCRRGAPALRTFGLSAEDIPSGGQ